MENLQQEKLSFEQSTSELLRNISELDELLQEMKERERLLVSFPDLHIPAEAQFECTGNITNDMEKQLWANNIRISILEEENSRLRAALAKMKEAAQQGVLRLIPQTQLWAHFSSRTGSKDSMTDPHKASTGKPALTHRPPSSTVPHWLASGQASSQSTTLQRRPSSQPKPSSAEAMWKAASCISLPVETSAIDTYTRLKGKGSAARVQARSAHSPRNHQK
ncbi:coiled-coil domain-containing protein 157 isoform 6-T7 [Pangshura tecta]